jgi:cobalt/nickel transport system permease protein
MHIPDGFIDAPVSLAGGVVAVAGIAVAARKVSAELEDRDVPLAGLTGAYVFAMQMLNFPVAGGTSGHLLGGCLAAVLVGPWMACLVMTVVLGVQALVFADGGLSALGLNIIVMGIVPAFAGAFIVRTTRVLLPRSDRMLVAASAFAAWCTVVLASVVFTGYFALGGTVDIATGTVAASMLGVHALIGIGEAVLTGLTVSAVLVSRPDLVHAARHRTPMRSRPTSGAIAAGSAP